MANQQYMMLLKNCHKEFMVRYNLPSEFARAAFKKAHPHANLSLQYDSSMNPSIYKAWDEFYEETMQSKINITYGVSHTGCQTPAFDPSPLMLIGRVKELIKEQSSINDINYIHIFKGGGGPFSPTYNPNNSNGWGEELDDNKSLHSYGYSGEANLHVYLWDPKNPPKIEEPSPAPAPEPAPSPSPAPVQRLTSSVIQATPLSESDNAEITQLKIRVAKLEERLRELELKYLVL
jgi:hypothetical protein